MRMTRIGLLGLATLTATAVVAHQGVTNPAVMARMHTMSLISDNVKTLGTMAKGQRTFDKTAAREAAAAIADHAALSTQQFTAPETDPKSEALPVIWENFDDFAAKSKGLEDTARALSTSIQTVADVQAGMGALGQSCKSCHAAYRE